jgi:hypothetical protein
MQDYPDPHVYIQERLADLADEYWSGLDRLGLPSNEQLKRAWLERAVPQMEDGYKEEAGRVLEHNIRMLQTQHKQRDKVIWREGALVGLVVCLILALGFSAVAWYDFAHADALWLIPAVGALSFLIVSCIAARLRR